MSSMLDPLWQNTFNRIINTGPIQTHLQAGKKDLTVLILKGKQKPGNSPDSYGLIFFTSVFYKKYLKNKTKQKQITDKSPTFPYLQQQCFQQNLGCITAHFYL